MKGENMGSEQLVGVTQLMIQKGTVIQQRFYNSIENLYKECYQHIASVGKRVYIQNKVALVNMVGDDAADILELSEDIKLEDFRADVFTTADPQQERVVIDQKILQYFQMGLLDQRRVSNLLERGTSIDLSMALREFGREKAEMERQVAEQQQLMMQQQAMAQQENEAMQMARQDGMIQSQLDDKQKDRDARLQETAMKVMPSMNPENQQM
jgi:hypothetical protein